jgi:2-iminoacetate synthase ThiH
MRGERWWCEAMSRRPATVTQADIARVIRAAKQEGAASVVVQVGQQASITIRLTDEAKPLEQVGEIVL